MTQQVQIEVHQATPETARQFELGRQNLLWFSDNAVRLRVYEIYRGRYVAAAGGELFVGDSPEVVESLAFEAFPNDVPHVQYIPVEKRTRIYAG